MCLDPASMTALTLAKVSAGMSAATAALSYVQGNAQASAQSQAIQRNAEMQQADLDRRAGEQAQATAAQMNDQARKAQADMALFDTISGEFGGGVTQQRASAAMGIQQGEALATIGKNHDSTARQGSFDSLALKSQTASQLASISRPSLLGTALTIGGSYVGYRQNVDGLKPITKTPGIQ